MSVPLLRNSEVALGGTTNDFKVVSTRLGARLKTKLASVAPDTIMYDSTNLFNIPTSAKAVASYDTSFVQSAAAWARFAGKLEVHIVQRAGVYHEGDVLDVETGAANLSDVHPFIAGRKGDGYDRPTIYCSLSWVQSVRNAAGAYRLGVDYDLWVAHWTGSPHVAYPGAAVTQYASTSRYDLSVISDGTWPHRKAPVVVPPPVEDLMTVGATGAQVKLLQTRLNVHGAKVAVDGVYGAQTLAAVIAFKQKHKITDGRVGTVTWRELLA